MNVKIDEKSKIPVYIQLSNQLKMDILSGKLPIGSILPSERAMAQLLGVHRNTVARAYNELKAEELIDSRQGVGYEVRMGEWSKTAEKRVSPKDTEADYSRYSDRQAGTKPKPERKPVKKVNWFDQIKVEYIDMEVTFDDLFQRFGDEKLISMGSGIACPGIYDKHQIAEDLANMISEEGKVQYFYSPYKGELFLRKKITSFLSTKGVKATAGQIQILTETNQALDFLVMLLIKPGDTVIMEEPVSPDVYRAIELAGSKLVTVPVDKEGMMVDRLEDLVIQHKPRFIYVNSSFHDPTGTILSLERRKRILEISNQYRIPIIEEDAASELVYEGEKLPPIKAFDTAQNVIYIYSFSLTFVPGLSLAFVAADKNVIRSLSYLVSVRMVSTDWIAQKLVAGYLDGGSYYNVLETFRDNYGRKQELVCNRLDEMRDLGVAYERPRGGVYIWCRLPAGIDSKKLTETAYKRGLALLPGHVFYPFKNGGRDHIRINYSYETEERLEVGMRLLRESIEDELAQEK